MANGQEIISAITNLEVKEMGLKTNDSVLALIKSTDTMHLKGDVENINISANNKLSGRISDIHKGIAMGSVTINTESGKFTSAITRHAIDELGIQNGEPVTPSLMQQKFFCRKSNHLISPRLTLSFAQCDLCEIARSRLPALPKQ